MNPEGRRGYNRQNARISPPDISNCAKIVVRTAAMQLPARQKNVSLVSMKVNHNRPVRLVSVHLISTPPLWRVLQTGNSSRLRQALALVDALDQADASDPVEPSGDCDADCVAFAGPIGNGVSTIVAGDLNTWSNGETTLRHLRRHFPDSPPPLDHPTRGPFPTDHILFRRRDGWSGSPAPSVVSYRRVDDDYYSDHHPIVARVTFAR